MSWFGLDLVCGDFHSPGVESPAFWLAELLKMALLGAIAYGSGLLVRHRGGNYSGPNDAKEVPRMRS
jgi:hypothetical protein